MTAQFDMADLVLVPLTPIHIGGGEEAMLRPETYRLAGDAVELFAPARVLADLPEAQRRQIVADLARDPLGTMDRIRDRVGPTHVLERIPASPESLRELEPSVHRSGKVNAFQRAGSGPLIPGSSLKGALRTAWLARETATLAPASIPPGRFGEDATFEAIRRSAAGDALMRRGFGFGDGRDWTDADPFRDVTVEDASLPPSATRIDPVASWKRVDGAFGFGTTGQMHWERTLSVLDGGPAPVIRLRLGVRCADLRARRPKDARAPARPPDSVAALLAALEAQHAPLWAREAEQTFFAGPMGQRLRDALALFGQLRREGPDPDAALLRLGRGSHAESKSVAAFRTVHRPQARTRGREFAREGSTRHVVNLGGRPAPFGWALLARADRWRDPAAWLGASAKPAPAAAPPAAAPGLLYRAGDRIKVDGDIAIIVSNVRDGDREAMVDFGDGPEPVKLSRIDP
jgi:CRISPR-associated protein Csm5